MMALEGPVTYVTGSAWAHARLDFFPHFSHEKEHSPTMKYLYAIIVAVVVLALRGHYARQLTDNEDLLTLALVIVLPWMVLRFGPKP